MKRLLVNLALPLACAFLAACAVITVNVYFPEKAAKEAYQSLDEMLLPSGEKAPAGQKAPGVLPGAPPAPQAKPQEKPQSSLFHELTGFEMVPAAEAADQTAATADQLAVEMSSMPEVLNAYAQIRSRLPRMHQLLDTGAVGLTNQGLVTVRDKSKVTPQDEAMIAAENQSRKTIVTSMAKAILKLEKQKETKAALDAVMGRAAATFADHRRDRAHPGWWIQLANGRWVQK